MKVVIDIPEILLDRIKSAKCVPDMYGSDIVNTVVCVRNSTQYEDRPQWIPCSERLPENINLVLVTWENTNPESYYKSIKGKKFCGVGHYCNGKWFWESNTCQDYLAEYGKCDWDEMDEAIKVIAWMPLPEPYKEEGESN